MNIQEDLSRGSFLDLHMLGKGAFGQVMLSKKRSNGKLFAIKEVNCEFVQKIGKVESIYRERDILEAMLDCSQIVSLDSTLLDEDNFYFVMEYA